MAATVAGITFESDTGDSLEAARFTIVTSVSRSAEFPFRTSSDGSQSFILHVDPRMRFEQCDALRCVFRSTNRLFTSCRAANSRVDRNLYLLESVTRTCRCFF